MSEIDYSTCTLEELKAKLTPKQLRFCEEFTKDLNKTQAAIRAGYAFKNAGAQGFDNYKKPEIYHYIQKKIAESTVSDDELLKMMSDISKSSVNDFIKAKKATRMVDIEYSLAVKIMRIEQEIQLKVAIHQNLLAKGLLYENESEDHDAEIAAMERRVTSLETELMMNPKATFTDQINEEYERYEFDLLAMSRDKELGRIASLQMTEFGPKVTMNSAAEMIKLLAQIKGMTTTKIDAKIQSENKNINVEVTPEEAAKIWSAIDKQI